MTKRADYTPPSCSFHDELEAHAVRREVVRIAFQDPDGAERAVIGTIADIWAEAGAEYLRTDEGTTIRLDRLKGGLAGGPPTVGLFAPLPVQRAGATGCRSSGREPRVRTALTVGSRPALERHIERTCI